MVRIVSLTMALFVSNLFLCLITSYAYSYSIKNSISNKKVHQILYSSPNSPSSSHHSRAFIAPIRKYDVSLSANFGIDDARHDEDGESINTHDSYPAAMIVGNFPALTKNDADDMANALLSRGFRTVVFEGKEGIEGRGVDVLDASSSGDCYYKYLFSKATGMLKLIGGEPSVGSRNGYSNVLADSSVDPPKWIPVISNEENLLNANGWSFLDADESEPISAFDVDAANEEGLYRPKWGDDLMGKDDDNEGRSQIINLSSLGYDLRRMSTDEVMKGGEILNVSSRSILLDGATDPRNIKTTHNGWKFDGPTGLGDVEDGIFFCAIGGLPLFAISDLSVTTASSGWLTFMRPIAEDHIILVPPEGKGGSGAGDMNNDSRIEVLCARSGCHLGHYFGKGEGFCINASALEFIPCAAASETTSESKIIQTEDTDSVWNTKKGSPLLRPVCWNNFDSISETSDEFSGGDLTLSERMLRNVLYDKITINVGESSNRGKTTSPTETATFLLGAGCFWHVESSLRHLPGVITTCVGYAGGFGENVSSSPTYEDVCAGQTGHAEVVRIVIDTATCNPSKLFDCFLSMHDPTKVRSHGKHAAGTGQYRSCLFVTNAHFYDIATSCVKLCQKELGKDICTEVTTLKAKNSDNEGQQCSPSISLLAKTSMSIGNDTNGWFWPAEDRHQRHDERVKKQTGSRSTESIKTISFMEWLKEYGRRAPSRMGSSESLDDSVAK